MIIFAYLALVTAALLAMIILYGTILFTFWAFRSAWRWLAVAFAIIAMSLSGCAAKPATTLALSPCVTAKPEATKHFPADDLTPDLSIFDKVKLLLADREERKVDRVQLLAITEACH